MPTVKIIDNPAAPTDDLRLLPAALRDPASIAALPLRRQDRLLRLARRAHLIAALGRRARAAGAIERLDPAWHDRFEAGEVVTDEHKRRIRTELHQVVVALRGLDVRLTVLKGGAYIQAGFENADGRMVADIDVLVPREQLPAVEDRLRRRGWVPDKLDEYDQHYYRDWMHELPPLRHPLRGVVVDVHHNILPMTGRLRIDANRLLQRVVPLPGEGLFRLCDEDMVIHVCCHLFQDGDLDNRLRELLDLDDLLRRFSAEDAGYWQRLVERGRELGAMSPLAYGLRFAAGLLGTPVPEEVLRDVGRPSPWSWLASPIMRRSLLPETGERPSLVRGLAVRLMYWRSHWLRMPPGMLFRHLFTQARRRGGLKPGEAAHDPN